MPDPPAMDSAAIIYAAIIYIVIVNLSRPGAHLCANVMDVTDDNPSAAR